MISRPELVLQVHRRQPLLDYPFTTMSVGLRDPTRRSGPRSHGPFPILIAITINLCRITSEFAIGLMRTDSAIGAE